MNRHVLAFEDGIRDEMDSTGFIEALDDEARIYTLDDHVCFVKSSPPAAKISDRFTGFAGSRLFFVADLTSSSRVGRMPGSFWDYIKNAALPAAAE